MNFQNAVKVCFQKYATFAGRAPRSEYWFFFLFSFLVAIGAQLLDMMFGTDFEMNGDSLGYGSIYALTALVMF